MNEIPTHTPPEGVNGPTLGRDLPDGCERAFPCDALRRLTDQDGDR